MEAGGAQPQEGNEEEEEVAADPAASFRLGLRAICAPVAKPLILRGRAVSEPHTWGPPRGQGSGSLQSAQRQLPPGEPGPHLSQLLMPPAWVSRLSQRHAQGPLSGLPTPGK